jgi:hypothetical protein
MDEYEWGWELVVGCYDHSNESKESVMQEISWLDEKLLASQEELCSSEIGRIKKMVTAKRREKKAEDKDKRKIDEVKK